MSNLLTRLLTTPARRKAEHHARVRFYAAQFGLDDPYERGA